MPFCSLLHFLSGGKNMGLSLNNILQFNEIQDVAAARWQERIGVKVDREKLIVNLRSEPELLPELCGWLFSELGYSFATLVAEERSPHWIIRYIFYGPLGTGQVHVTVRFPLLSTTVPSISRDVHAADWQEREIEDLFGLLFVGHPRLGDFVLHEEWPEGINPMRTSFDAGKPYPFKEAVSEWQPKRILEASGSFMMPIGPVYSDHAESARFLLETVGEDVIRTIPRFFYKYRGVEKIAEGQLAERVVLLAERFSGTSAFAHSLAFCQAVEEIAEIDVPPRATALRVLLAELERLRHHMAAIAGTCSSTALAVAAAQGHILEEELLRLTCRLTGHRYLFGLNIPGGLSCDLPDAHCIRVSETLWELLGKLKELHEMLRFTSSFLDRLEEVGTVSKEKAVSYGLVGPVARASGVSRDLREVQPYAGYEARLKFQVPREEEGDGYARLRVLFSEAEQSVNLIRQGASSLPSGPVRKRIEMKAGAALGRVEAPMGAAFHWVRLDAKGTVERYRVMTPSFVNWHGFHLAAEDFAFQDFPIIMATFGLSNAECDR
jgi:formate hydrogenlyase subunit 5